MYNDQRDRESRIGGRDWERQDPRTRQRNFDVPGVRGVGLHDMDEDEDYGRGRDDYSGGVSSSEQRRYGRGASSEGYAGGYSENRQNEGFGREGYRSRMTTGGTSQWNDRNWGDRGYGSMMGRGGYESNAPGNVDQEGNQRGWNVGGYASPRGPSGFGNEGGTVQSGSWASSWRNDQQNRGQHVGRGPKGYKRSDERITEDVCEALSRHGEIDASEIEVKVQGGEVILTGSVQDRRDKRLAEDIVEQCSGVRDVRNEIRVQPSTTFGQSGQHQKDQPEGEPMRQGINAGSTIGLSGATPETQKR